VCGSTWAVRQQMRCAAASGCAAAMWQGYTLGVLLRRGPGVVQAEGPLELHQRLLHLAEPLALALALLVLLHQHLDLLVVQGTGHRRTQENKAAHKGGVMILFPCTSTWIFWSFRALDTKGRHKKKQQPKGE